MDRRAYLVGASSVAVAGCLGRIPGVGGGSEESEQEAEQQSNGEPPSSSANEPEPTGDVEPTENTESEPDQADDERQETSDEVEFNRAISRAETQYRLALSEYGNATSYEDATLLHVLPSTDVEAHNAREYIDQATDILWTDAREFTTTEDQQERVIEYRRYEDVIRDLSRIQRRIHRVYERIDPPENETLYTSRPSGLTSVRTDHEALGEKLAEMEVYMDELQTKYEQQRWQIKLLERTYTGLVNTKSRTRIDEQSVTELQLARNEFRTAREELEDTGSAPPEDITDEAFLERVTAWYTLTDNVFQEIASTST